jgi:hypothetical protein
MPAAFALTMRRSVPQTGSSSKVTDKQQQNLAHMFCFRHVLLLTLV